ncbi:unnamed protein product [Orchesella dallaii]|uniref:Odorant receptor n=1 Tax=Orchesella dallaii TaxID=48710 RepID=A0ABP1RI49_9HEXA
MDAPLLLKAFELTDILWRLPIYPKLFFVWNPKTLQFQTHPRHLHYITYCLFFLCPQLLLLVMVLVQLLVILPNSHFGTTINWIIGVGMLQCCIFTLSMNTLLFVRRVETIGFINSLISHNYFKGQEDVEYLDDSSPGLISCFKCLFKELVKFLRQENCDTIGILLNICALELVCICPLMAVCGVFLSVYKEVDLDFTFYIWMYYFEKNPGILVHIYRVILAYQHVSEIFWTASYILIIAVGLGNCILSSLQRIRKESKENFPRAMKNYKKFVVLQQQGRSIVSTLVFLLMGTGYAIIVVALSITVACFNILPIYVYWVAPVGSGIALLALVTILPYATSCYTGSLSILNEWSCRIMSKGRRKELKAMRPICFMFGSLKPLNNESKTEYLTSIFDRTMDLIMFLDIK